MTNEKTDSKNERTWAEKNGGTIFGLGIFAGLGLLTVLIYLANNGHL